MAQEEPEVSNELREIKDLVQEIEGHTSRVSKLGNENKLDAEMTAGELSGTVLPLLSDLAGAQLKHAAVMEDWLNDLEDEIESGSGDGDLADGEIELFDFLLDRFREFIAGVPEDAPAEIRQGMLELEVKISTAKKVLVRLKSESEAAESEEENSEGGGSEDADGSNT